MKLGDLLGRRAKKQDPCEGLALAMLEKAVGMSAKAIVFGVPRGVPWDVDKVKRESDAAMLKDSAMMNLKNPRFPKLTAEDLAFVERCSGLKYRNGYNNIPVWFEVEGRYCEAMPISGGAYGSLLATFAARLVPLPGAADTPQPMRYIELTPEAGQRRFVEVELIMAEDNTVRVEIVGLQTAAK